MGRRDGRAFCVGADLSSLGAPPDGDTRLRCERTDEWMSAVTAPLVLELHGMPVPVINAVNGPCAGGGVGLALVADMVLMARPAFLYLHFICKLGIVPDVGSSWCVQRLAGRARAFGLALTGERRLAETAVAWSLAWECVEDDPLRFRALELAHQLARLPAHGALEARRAVDAAAGRRQSGWPVDVTVRQTLANGGSWPGPGFPAGCRELTLAGTAIAPKVSFLAPPRTHTGGHFQTSDRQEHRHANDRSRSTAATARRPLEGAAAIQA